MAWLESFLSLCAALRVSVMHSENAPLAPVAGPAPHSMNRGAQRRASMQQWWLPAHTLLLFPMPRRALPSDSAGSRDSIPKSCPSSLLALSNLMCLQPQQRHVLMGCCSNWQVSVQLNISSCSLLIICLKTKFHS